MADRNPLARNLLELTADLSGDTLVGAIPGLTVAQLRSLCSTVIRLEVYLGWAEREAGGRDEAIEGDYQAGYVEAHRDVECVVLERNLERMLRDVGEEDLANELRELGVGS